MTLTIRTFITAAIRIAYARMPDNFDCEELVQEVLKELGL